MQHRNLANTRITLKAKYKKMDINCFPSSIEEGWIRPQFSLMAFSTGGDGVVGVLTFNHLPQIHESKKWQDKSLNHMDLGTPPEPGGEIFESLLNNKFQRRILQ
jgi:hypothetical protein